LLEIIPGGNCYKALELQKEQHFSNYSCTADAVTDFLASFLLLTRVQAEFKQIVVWLYFAVWT